MGGEAERLEAAGEPGSFDEAVQALAPEGEAALAPYARRERTAARVVKSEALRLQLCEWGARGPEHWADEEGAAHVGTTTVAEACLAAVFELAED